MKRIINGHYCAWPLPPDRPWWPTMSPAACHHVSPWSTMMSLKTIPSWSINWPTGPRSRLRCPDGRPSDSQFWGSIGHGLTTVDGWDSGRFIMLANGLYLMINDACCLLIFVNEWIVFNDSWCKGWFIGKWCETYWAWMVHQHESTVEL